MVRSAAGARRMAERRSSCPVRRRVPEWARRRRRPRRARRGRSRHPRSRSTTKARRRRARRCARRRCAARGSTSCSSACRLLSRRPGRGGRRWLERSAGLADASARAEIVDQVCGILSDARFAALFGARLARRGAACRDLARRTGDRRDRRPAAGRGTACLGDRFQDRPGAGERRRHPECPSGADAGLWRGASSHLPGPARSRAALLYTRRPEADRTSCLEGAPTERPYGR